MIKQFAFICFLCLVISHGYVSAQDGNHIPDVPNPPKLVNDYSLTLHQQELDALEHKLEAYHDSTSSQIAIVVVKTIGDYEISQYAFELALKWGIGQKDKNNGLLILWSTEDRKVFIATGYGFEEKVPDAICKRIVDQIIIPNFKLGSYYEGLNMATDEIISRMSGTFEADPNQGQGDEGIPLSTLLFLIVLFIVIIYLINKYGRGGGPGGGRRSLGGGFPWWIISNSGGSSWGSGGGWSGGSGGGFGGFGGGSFGGGGAGGSY